MTPADCDNLSGCSVQGNTGGTVLRTLGNRAVDFLSVEDFGCVGDGVADDRARFQDALNWSTQPGRAVYASRKYLLGSALNAFADTTLICTPSARILRGFGSAQAGAGGWLLTTGDTGEQANVWIEGGRWGYDYPGGRKTWKPLTVTFAYEGMAAGTSILTFASGLQFSDFAGYTQAVWLYGVPSSANNDQVFAFATDQSGLAANQIRVQGKVSNETSIAGFTASVVPPSGGGLKINSPGGTVRGVALVNMRGICFQVGGDRFRLLDSSSRNVTPDAGGGVRFTNGTDLFASGLYIESSDDCFQLNPSDSVDGIAPGATIDRASIVDSRGLTNQGALIALINGNGRAYKDGKDSLTRLTNVLVRNVSGVTGGSALHGGVAIKMYCANSRYPITNAWIEDVSVRQDDVTPPDTLRAGVMIVTGRTGGGVLNSGVRNLVVENRSGPLLAIGPADDLTAGYPFSKAVDFTLEQARAPGAGMQAGLPLIGAPFADRLVLRDVSGDLAGTGRALEIGVALTYVSGGIPQTIVAGLIGELVIDGCTTAGAALPATDSGKRQGIWQFGNVAKASVRRLATTVAAGAPAVGGIELVKTAQPGATFCRFAEVDFTNIASTYEIATWQTQVGNEIAQSIGFDDRAETVPPFTAGTTTIAPERFAPTIALSLASGVGSASITAMTPPGIPRRAAPCSRRRASASPIPDRLRARSRCRRRSPAAPPPPSRSSGSPPPTAGARSRALYETANGGAVLQRRRLL